MVSDLRPLFISPRALCWPGGRPPGTPGGPASRRWFPPTAFFSPFPHAFVFIEGGLSGLVTWGLPCFWAWAAEGLAREGACWNLLKVSWVLPGIARKERARRRKSKGRWRPAGPGLSGQATGPGGAGSRAKFRSCAGVPPPRPAAPVAGVRKPAVVPVFQIPGSSPQALSREPGDAMAPLRRLQPTQRRHRVGRVVACCRAVDPSRQR